MANAFVEISDADLDAAIAGSRQRGLYDENYIAFVDSGKRGVEVNLAEGDHAGKKAQSVKTGYESAIERIKSGKIVDASDEVKEAAANTKVLMKNERVFLLRQDIS
jgi:hypothetical protein